MASANGKNNLQEVFLQFKMGRGGNILIQHSTGNLQREKSREVEEWKVVCWELLDFAAQDKVRFLECSISQQTSP